MPNRLIAVVGTPNVGKSTLFNALTGLNQRVGNFPGVTVEPMVGAIRVHDTTTDLIDLPGLYSLRSASEDEVLTASTLAGNHPSIPRPHAILLVMNATDLEKCLVLFSSLAHLQIPMAIALTMVDSVKASGGTIDDIGLMHELGVPVIPVVGRKGLGVGDVIDVISSEQQMRVPPEPLSAPTTVPERFVWARKLVDSFTTPGTPSLSTRKLDSVLLHPLWGSVVFVAVMTLFFQSIFTWAEPLMEAIEGGIALLQSAITASMEPSLIRSFLQKGLLGGVGSVLVFLPQILILNVLIVFLEESGYLARAAFLVDRFMGLFGLQGRSFIPLLGSFACAIPGIMSARIIPSYRDRLATIMATPLMTCSARLPVYTLLIGAVIPSATVFGVFGLKGLVMASLYVIGALSGLCIALFLKKTLFRGATVPFLIEFPPYRLPSAKSMMITTVGRSKDFLKTAGTVILAFSIGLWILTEIPRYEPQPGEQTVAIEHAQLEQSLAADIGKAIQPIFAPLGFDWRITLGVLSSYAARETFVSAMGQIYAADVSESDSPLRSVLSTTLPLSVGLSILAFYVFALQCISTMAIMKRETGTWKWPALAFVITFVLAYTSSLAVYTAFSQ